MKPPAWPAMECNRPRHTTMTDDDRRQRAKQYWPPTLCVGGPVKYAFISFRTCSDVAVAVRFVSALTSRCSRIVRQVHRPFMMTRGSSVILVCTSGGAGEGKQHLTPSGSLKNVHQVKSDEALPFYCHPPNPCPKGYTSKPPPPAAAVYS